MGFATLGSPPSRRISLRSAGGKMRTVRLVNGASKRKKPERDGVFEMTKSGGDDCK
jgi:hypothetical protein